MSDPVEQVRAYAPDADEAVVAKMAAAYRLTLDNPDAALVSFSDREERETVRENFLKKKLGLTQSDEELDRAFKEVGTAMGEGRRKPRLAAYYLLAERFGKLDVFR